MKINTTNITKINVTITDIIIQKALRDGRKFFSIELWFISFSQ